MIATAMHDASTKPVGSNLHATRLPSGRYAIMREIHHNPQDFVNNLLITARPFGARRQRLRRGANCLISLRSKFKFFYHLARFVKSPLGP